MASINVIATTTNQTAIFYAGTDSDYQSVLISATIQAIRPDIIGDVLPSPEPNEGIQPPIPGGLQPLGYIVQPFDYLTLPRLELQSTQTLVSSVERTELLVIKRRTGTVYDLSDRFINGDWSAPIAGAAAGSIEIGELGANDFDIADLNLDYGDRILWQQCWGNVCLDIADCYILNKPVFKSDGGFLKYTISIGDELALKSDTSRVPVTKYCGAPPSTAGQAAAIYAKTHNLNTRIFPAGHRLLDLNYADFSNERPYDFLSALYAPTNHDVRTDETGIIVRVRKPYDASKAIVLPKESVIETEPTFTQSYKPTTKIKVKNDYSIVNDFEIVTTTDRAISGVPSNTKPWFQGGYTETITERAVLGDTEVWSKVTVNGYIPAGTGVTEEQYNEDACSDSTIETYYGIISTKYVAKEYKKHLSQAFLVTQEREWFYTKALEKIDDFYWLRDNLKNYSLTKYKHTAQINDQVCEKDYLHFLTYSRQTTYELAPNFNDYILTGDVITEYKMKGKSALNQDSFVGVDQSWTQTVITGAYDKENLAFVIQPTKETPVNNPPGGLWIRPSLTNVIAFRTVELDATGSLETKPMEAPYCYTEAQMETFGMRTLREIYGLSQGLNLVVPFYLNIGINDSVIYEDKPYVVYNTEINQTLNEATKTITLARWID